MTERKLARVVEIDEIVVHPNADSLELAVVGGWQCCVKKGEFKAGDKAVYFECDALIPLTDDVFTFLEGKGNVTRNNMRYARIKTIKLRGELSQGLLFPLATLKLKNLPVDTDLTSKLGVIKYEKVAEPVAGQNNSSGSVSKPFPAFIFKTDQERVQNLKRHYQQAVESGEEFEVTYKLDGSSFTAYIRNGKVGVCSRNIELNLNPEKWGIVKQCFNWANTFIQYNKRFKFNRLPVLPKWKTGNNPDDNAFTQLFHSLELTEALRSVSSAIRADVALQGEMVGPSIQKNFEGVTENKLFIYNIFNIDTQKYLLPDEAKRIVTAVGLDYVPVYSHGTKLSQDIQNTIDLADGPSGVNGKYREGLVFKSLTRDFSFKVISNNYCLLEP